MADDDDLGEGKAKKKAVPTFEPHHVFNCGRVYRDMAKYSMRNCMYNVAKDKLDLAVSLTKKEDDLVDSLYLRSKCYEKMIDIPSAMADCDRALATRNLPYINYLKGQLLYKQNRFEDALSTFAKNCRKKAYPDNFDYGVAMVTGTMQNCVGRNAGPLGKFILEMKMRAAPKNGMNNEELKMHNDRMERKKKAFSEKYLGSLADDKRMITEIYQSPPMLGDNEAVDMAVRQLERVTVEKLDYLEDCLWQRKPLYCYEHLRIKPSPKRINELKISWKIQKKILVGELDRQMKKLGALHKKGDWVELYKLAEYMRKKVWGTPKEQMSCKSEYMTKIIDIVGEMYLGMKTFKKHWSIEWNDKRLIVMIGLDRPQTSVYDLCKEAFHAPILDIRAKLEEYTEYFHLTEDEYQKMYYNFEIACLYSMLGMWREARSFSKTSIFDARKQTNIVWYINALFVFARSEVQDASFHDAMVTLIAIREACRRFGFREQEEFFNRALTVLHNEPQVKKVPQVHKSSIIREQQIIHLMPDFELKSQAKSLFSRMSKKPPWRRMMLMKGAAMPVSEKEEEPDIITEALEERELMKDEKIAVKKAKAQAAAASEKKELTTILAIEGVDNYTMRKLIDKYRKSSFNMDNFQT
uniref:Tetratricopeptide repeat protein 25 n=1 Tax=Lygus hesperus TaxID=30085 RepID=A0A0A9WKE7_LYGHE